jgi:hypothetical protein
VRRISAKTSSELSEVLTWTPSCIEVWMGRSLGIARVARVHRREKTTVDSDF